MLHASNRWVKVTSTHFELYSNNSPKKSAAFLRDMEQIRGAFARSNPIQGVEFRIRIVAFRSRAEYLPYASDPQAAAFFLPGHHRDYIVLQDLEPEHKPIAIHEYTHAAIAALGLRLPVWLNEGLAELYSTAKQKNGELMVGSPPISRLACLRTSNLMGLEHVFAVNTRTVEYSSKTNWLGLFYAQSWLLAHMLKFSDPYATGFPRFLAAVGEGQSAGDSLAEVYGKSLPSVAGDLSHYVSENNFKSEAIAHSRTEPDVVIEMRGIPAAESNIVLGDLLATLRRFNLARRILVPLLQQQPHNPQLEEALAYLSLRQNDAAEAGWYFSQAAADGDDNPRLYYDYARLMLAQGMPHSAAVHLLQHALALEPRYDDVRKQLDSMLLLGTQPDFVFVASANPSPATNIKGFR